MYFKCLFHYMSTALQTGPLALLLRCLLSIAGYGSSDQIYIPLNSTDWSRDETKISMEL